MTAEKVRIGSFGSETIHKLEISQNQGESIHLQELVRIGQISEVGLNEIT